jgi:hypothetical protein
MTLDVAWATARTLAANIQTLCASLQTQIASNVCSSQSIVNAYTYLYSINTQLATIAAVPGIVAYAQAQVNNPSLDIAGAFTAMQNAVLAVTNWIAANFPVSNGYLQCLQISGGNLVWITFNTAQLSGLASLLTALSATID